MPNYRTYRIHVKGGLQAGLHEYRAETWEKAFAWALECFPDSAKMVEQYYFKIKEIATGRIRVVSELDLPHVELPAFTHEGKPLSARTWLEAKKLFDIPLSAEQQKSLEVQLRLLEGR